VAHVLAFELTDNTSHASGLPTMTAPIHSALLYITFAILFIAFNFLLDLFQSQEIYYAAVSEFVHTPFRLDPKTTINDIRCPEDVYEWLTKAFFPIAYKDGHTNGDNNGFCSKSFPCLMNEGDVDSLSQCTKYLQTGSANCPGFMTGGADCCTFCTGDDCGTFTLQLKDQNFVVNMSVEDLSASCNDTVPDWTMDFFDVSRRLQVDSEKDLDGGVLVEDEDEDELPPWPESPRSGHGFLPPAVEEQKTGAPPEVGKNRAHPMEQYEEMLLRNAGLGDGALPGGSMETVDDASGDERPERSLSGSSKYHFKFCPERLTKMQQEKKTVAIKNKGRLLMMSGYNRVLMGRITLKRMQIVDSNSIRFSNAYQKVFKSEKLTASKYNEDEDTRHFGSTHDYTYESGEGFDKAGGFVQHLIFEKTIYEHLSHMKYLKDNHWFNLDQGSLVVELILFNGNTQKFVRISFVFEHTFAGQTTTRVEVQPFTLSLLDMDNPQNYARLLVEILLLCLYFFFVKNELDDMSLPGYFYKFANLLHLATLAMMTFCIAWYAWLVLDYPYRRELEFEYPRMFLDEHMMEQRKKSFDKYCDIANKTTIFMNVETLTLCLVFIRVFTLMMMAVPRSGIIFNTIAQASRNLLTWVLMTGIMFFGFSAAAHYLFGTNVFMYSTFGKSFVMSFSMIIGQSNFERLQRGDDNWGLVYYFSFHLYFIILVNMLIAILTGGYIREKNRLMNPEFAKKDPTKRIIKQMDTWLRSISWISKIQIQFSTFLTGSQSAHINQEQIAKWRDKRATKPRIRMVQYDRTDPTDKDANDKESNPSLDIVLKAEDPFYPGGLMHYVVEKVAHSDGPAADAKVLAGYHLVAIKEGPSVDEDRIQFRSRDKYYHKDKHNQDVSNVLKGLEARPPVQLEFQGAPNFVSMQCLLLIVYGVVYTLMMYYIADINQSFYLQAVNNDLVTKSDWWEYNPTRVSSFENIRDMEMIYRWAQKSVLYKSYKCVTDYQSPEACPNLEKEDLWQWTRPNFGVWFDTPDPEAEFGGTKITRDALSVTRLRDIQKIAARSQNRSVSYWNSSLVRGISLGFAPNVFLQDKSPVNPEKETIVKYLPRLHNWNVAVNPVSHVRVTFQLGCYIENPNKRWDKGYPMVLEYIQRRITGCADEPCTKDLIKHEGFDQLSKCFSIQGGVPINPKRRTGSSTGVIYKYSEHGTYGNYGGMSVGLGGTYAEAEAILRGLFEDGMFRGSVISVVFDWAMYNGNIDMFSYTRVRFSQLHSGMLQKDVYTHVFPMTIFTGGDNLSKLRARIALVCIYCVMTSYFTGYFFYDLFRQYRISHERQRRLYFSYDFFKEDPWNILDVTSVALNLTVLVLFLIYITYADPDDPDASIFTSWPLAMYDFKATVGLQGHDPLNKFQQASDYYQMFLQIGGLNCFFVVMRVLRFFTVYQQFRLVLSTIGSAGMELLGMMIVLFILLLGFMMMFNIFFGMSLVEKYGSLVLTATQLFLLMIGSFDIEPMIRSNLLFTLVLWPICAFLFFFVFANMFLVSMVHSWKETRKSAQDLSISKFLHHLSEGVRTKISGEVYKGKPAKDQTKVKLDKNFWRSLSVLNHLSGLDVHGKVEVSKATTRGGKGAEDADVKRAVEEGVKKAVAAAEAGHDGAERSGSPSAVENNTQDKTAEHKAAGWKKEHKDTFKRTFDKAHQEIAASMSRAINLHPETQTPRHHRDSGKGVGDLEEVHEGNGEAPDADVVHDDFKMGSGQPSHHVFLAHHRGESTVSRFEVGIVEEKVDQQVAQSIKEHMEEKLKEEEHQAEEIWLDALLTVLEDSNYIDELQKAFRPPQMIKPKSPGAWEKFYAKQRKMERRLDLFLRILQNATRKQHYEYLRNSAKMKQKVMKKQTLALLEYMDRLEKDMKAVNADIKNIEQKNEDMQNQLRPLIVSGDVRAKPSVF